MYRQIARSSLARQARARIARSYSSASSSSAKSSLNSKLVAGAVVPIAMAVGYFATTTSTSSLISNDSTADRIRKAVSDGNAMADDQAEKFAAEQSRLRKETSDAKIEGHKKQAEENTKEAGATDSKDIASDSDVRDKAADELNEDSSRHANSDPRVVEEKAIKKEEIRSNKQEDDEKKQAEEQGDKKKGGDEEKGDGSDEGKQEAAYNPETGEINWDCPCLGGMAHGPCGEEFKEAFSCFVFSETEPKGIDCIKKFENMRSCFKKHPEDYKEELYTDDHELDTEAVEHVVLEEAEPAVKDIEDGLDSGKLKPKKE